MPLFPAAKGSINASPADVGRRLTLRYRDGFAQPDLEAVGVLDRWTGGLADGILRIRTRDGDAVGVRAQDLVAVRVVAPEISAYELQWEAQLGWPAMESEPLGDWEMRASKGATGRANSVRVTGAGKGSMSETLDRVRKWYDERDLRPLLQVPTPSGLEAEFDELGWSVVRTSRMMVSSASRLVTAAEAARVRHDLEIEVRDLPNPDWMQLVPGYSPETVEEFQHVMDSVRPAAFVFCRNADGILLGVGRATGQGRWAGISNISTVPQQRRVGIATAITARLAEWAVEHDARHWYLQVYADNAAAISFWEKLGFTTHHWYEYRGCRPTQAGPDD